jgi:hypothetical protein
MYSEFKTNNNQNMKYKIIASKAPLLSQSLLEMYQPLLPHNLTSLIQCEYMKSHNSRENVVYTNPTQNIISASTSNSILTKNNNEPLPSSSLSKRIRMDVDDDDDYVPSDEGEGSRVVQRIRVGSIEGE